MKIIAITGGIIALLFALGMLALASPWIETALSNRFFAKEIAGDADLPWAAPGRKARYYSLKSWDWNNGITGVAAWGSSSWHKENPIDTGFAAFAFLEKHRAMDAWAEAGTFETYNVYDQLGPEDRYQQDSYGNTVVTYTQRVAPYRFFVVSIEPTVVVMQSAPHLPEWWHEHVRQEYSQTSRWSQWYRSLPEKQLVPYLAWLHNPLEFGTELPRGTGWKWFSPDLNQLPVDLPLTENGEAILPLKEGRLKFLPSASGWTVIRE
jgi:hypothetical protein